MKPEVFKELTQTFTLLGKTYTAQVTISTQFDDYTLDDLCDRESDPEHAEKLEADLEHGRASVLGLIVDAWCEELPDLTGNDSIWGNIIYGPNDVESVIVEHDMIKNALDDLVDSYKQQLDAARAKVTRLEKLQQG